MRRKIRPIRRKYQAFADSILAKRKPRAPRCFMDKRKKCVEKCPWHWDGVCNHANYWTHFEEKVLTKKKTKRDEIIYE